VAQDYAKAREWFKKAADKGLRLAGHDLFEPLSHRPRHHRHRLEWPPVLRSWARERAPTSQQEWKCAESRNGSYPASGLNTASVLDTAPHAIFVVTLVELTRRYHQSMISNCALNATLGLSTRHLLCRDERIDAVQSSPTFLKPMGEARLGIGHHKVGFSMKRLRLAVSNISDCSDVISIYDYQNAFGIKLVKTFSATDLGYDGSTPLKACDERGKSA
jgi:TPR repeat protein